MKTHLHPRRDRLGGHARRALRLPDRTSPADMHPIDWTIVAAYLVWIVWDGLRQARQSKDLEGYPASPAAACRGGPSACR